MGYVKCPTCNNVVTQENFIEMRTAAKMKMYIVKIPESNIMKGAWDIDKPSALKQVLKWYIKQEKFFFNFDKKEFKSPAKLVKYITDSGKLDEVVQEHELKKNV